MNQFIDDYQKELEETKEGELPKIDSVKTINFDNICNSITEYYRNEPENEKNEENENNEIQINKPKTILRKSLK
jgi:ribosome biogenesis GTPase A